MIEVFDTIAGLRAALASHRAQGASVAFVPTMGFLHDGHLSLMRLARAEADVLVASIFVNPTQFDNEADLDIYPRDMSRDTSLCASVGVDMIFAPASGQMYAQGAQTTVSVAQMTGGLCGASRPGHFEGVTTVVTKLFNIVQPDVAVFGQKDYQQLAVIRQMVRDLDMPVRILGGPIVREPDGLAMSSRNVHLKGEARLEALCLSQALRRAQRAVGEGERSSKVLLAQAVEAIEAHALARIDYIEVVHPRTLAPTPEVGAEGAVMAMAVFIEETRLIDNMLLETI